MYRHILIDEDGQSHEMLPGASYYGDDAPAMAQAALVEDGWRYVNVNRMPYLDGRPFTGTIQKHWGAVYHFREGLLNDPDSMVPAVSEPGPRGQVCFYKNGRRDDPCEGVPALIPNDSPVVFYRNGVARPQGSCAVNEEALAMVRAACQTMQCVKAVHAAMPARACGLVAAVALPASVPPRAAPAVVTEPEDVNIGAVIARPNRFRVDTRMRG